MTAADLRRVPFKATQDRMISLGELCDLVAGRVALVIELKSRFDGDLRLVRRAAAVLAGYGGAAAVMSFDPNNATLRLTIGGKGMKEGIIELKARTSKDVAKVPLAEAEARVAAAVTEAAARPVPPTVTVPLTEYVVNAPVKFTPVRLGPTAIERGPLKLCSGIAAATGSGAATGSRWSSA